MGRLAKKLSKQVGLAPGSMVHIGDKGTEKMKITIIDYNQEKFQEKVVGEIEECFSFKETPTVTWINIDGLSNSKVIEKIGKQFDIHPLVLEDIVNTGQRQKLEDFESYLFIVYQ